MADYGFIEGRDYVKEVFPKSGEKVGGRLAVECQLTLAMAKEPVIGGATPAEILVAVKPMVEGMGLDWEGQRLKLQRHPLLKTCTFITKVQAPGDDQARELTCLPLARVPFWLATLHPNRIDDIQVREAVLAYQAEVADALLAQSGER